MVSVSSDNDLVYFFLCVSLAGTVYEGEPKVKPEC